MAKWKELEKYLVEGGQLQVGKRGRPIRRCQSVAPIHGNQCEKGRRHNKIDNRVAVHKAGALIWCDNGQHEHFGEGELEERTDKLLGKGRAGAAATKVIFDETHAFRDGLFTNYGIPPLLDITTFGDTDRIFQSFFKAEAPAPQPKPLAEWWRAVSEQEIEATVPKAIEYGATDLIDIGTQLGKWMNRDITDAEAAELGCWFYLIGKMARATSAIDRSEFPSDDTLKDIGVYVKMIQRIRSAGSWPGEELPTDGE
jgi:hypothetical protein